MNVLQQSYKSMELILWINADRVLSLVTILGALAAGAALATMV